MPKRGTGISKRFDAIKRKNPGMSDSKAMETAIAESSKAHMKERKLHTAAVKAKKVGPLEKLKMGITKELSKRRHSKAGRKYLGR